MEKRRFSAADDAPRRRCGRLAGDDAADDAIVREHAANDGKRAKRANDADDKRDAAREYASSNIVEAARRLDAVVDAASRVVFVSAPEVSALEVEPELDERLFKAFGVVAARCASLAKRCAQKNAALLGGSRVGASHAASGLDASRALAEEMRVDRSSSFGPSRVLRVYESSKLWDAVKKHNAVVWGRALAACEASEKAVLLKKKSLKDERIGPSTTTPETTPPKTSSRRSPRRRWLTRTRRIWNSFAFPARSTATSRTSASSPRDTERRGRRAGASEGAGGAVRVAEGVRGGGADWKRKKRRPLGFGKGFGDGRDGRVRRRASRASRRVSASRGWREENEARVFDRNVRKAGPMTTTRAGTTLCLVTPRPTTPFAGGDDEVDYAVTPVAH